MAIAITFFSDDDDDNDNEDDSYDVMKLLTFWSIDG